MKMITISFSKDNPSDCTVDFDNNSIENILNTADEIIDILKKNDLTYCEAVEALRTCEVILKAKCKIN